MIKEQLLALIESADLMDETCRLMLADALEEFGAIESADTLRAGPVLYILPNLDCTFWTLPDDYRIDIGCFVSRDNEQQGLSPYEEYADWIDYRNQREVWGDSLEGDWFYADDQNCVIYTGTFGNDHGPHAYAAGTTYETREEYERQKAEYEEMPEYEQSEYDDMEEAEENGDDEPNDDYPLFDELELGSDHA